MPDRDIQRANNEARPHLVDSEATEIEGPASIEDHFGDLVEEVLFRNKARQSYDEVHIRNMTIFRLPKDLETLPIADSWRDEQRIAQSLRDHLFVHGPKPGTPHQPVVQAFLNGWVESAKTRKTSESSYAAMRQACFALHGELEEVAHGLIAETFPPAFARTSGEDFASAFGGWLQIAGNELREEGLFVSREALPSDHDRMRFVKVFVYLDDVAPDNGPHVYVEGTHKIRPNDLWSAERVSDQTVFANTSRAEARTLTGPAGTWFDLPPRKRTPMACIRVYRW